MQNCVLATTMALALASGAYADDDLIITLDAHATAQDVQAVEALGGTVRHVYSIIPAMAVTMPDGVHPALAALEGVVVIEQDTRGWWLGDNELDATWAVKQVGGGEAHALGATGGGVGIALMDSGINENHEDLVDNYVFGYDFEGNDDNPDEPFGHGTYVAGCAAAVDNGIGVVGIASEADIYMLKVGSFGPQSGAVIAALDYAVNNGLKVTNSSFGLFESQAVTNAYNAAWDAGILNIAAAGNTGGFVTYPATLDSVMAISATNINKSLAGFSARGPEIDVAAPGDNIWTTSSNGGYGSNSGTSFSSPYTVGVAAIVYGIGPADANGNGRINDEVWDIITESAEDLGAQGFDILYGHGLIDAEAAALLALASSCTADFNHDGELTILDFVAFQDAFSDGDLAADCDGSGALNIVDFVCFQDEFTAGCE